MDKKGIQEIKKCFKKEDCRIDRIRSCFVSEEGEVLSQFSDSFFSLEDEEMHKYWALFKQSLSGKFGRELYTLEFPLSEEETGGKQDSLYRLNESELKEAGLCENFFQKIRESYPVPGKKLLILAHGVYDVPQKGTDGITMEDASDTVLLLVPKILWYKSRRFPSFIPLFTSDPVTFMPSSTAQKNGRKDWTH